MRRWSQAFERCARRCWRRAAPRCTRIALPPMDARHHLWRAWSSRVEGGGDPCQWMREQPRRLRASISAPGCSAATPSRRPIMSRRWPAAARCCRHSRRRRFARLRRAGDADHPHPRADAGGDRHRRTVRRAPRRASWRSRPTRGPFNYLGLPTVSVPCGFDPTRPADRAADRRPSVRRGARAEGGRRLSAGHRLAPPGAGALRKVGEEKAFPPVGRKRPHPTPPLLSL